MHKNVLRYYVQLLQMTLTPFSNAWSSLDHEGFAILLFYLINCCFISVPSASFLMATSGIQLCYTDLVTLPH